MAGDAIKHTTVLLKYTAPKLRCQEPLPQSIRSCPTPEEGPVFVLSATGNFLRSGENGTPVMRAKPGRTRNLAAEATRLERQDHEENTEDESKEADQPDQGEGTCSGLSHEENPEHDRRESSQDEQPLPLDFHP